MIWCDFLHIYHVMTEMIQQRNGRDWMGVKTMDCEETWSRRMLASRGRSERQRNTETYEAPHNPPWWGSKTVEGCLSVCQPAACIQSLSASSRLTARWIVASGYVRLVLHHPPLSHQQFYSSSLGHRATTLLTQPATLWTDILEVIHLPQSQYIKVWQCFKHPQTVTYLFVYKQVR